MMRRWHYALFFFITLVIALLASLPATRLVAWAGPLPAGVSIHGVAGTLWSGQAEMLVIAGEPLGAVSWQLSPWSLPLARADIKFSLNRDTEYLLGELSWSGADEWRLSGLEGEMALASLWPQLKRQLPQLAALPVQIEGRLRFFLDELAVDGEGPRAHGRINWLGAAAGMPQALPLGDLSLQLQGREGRFADAGGPLRLEGDLGLTAGGEYNVELRLAAREGAAPQLSQGLAFLGVPDAEGLYRYRMKGPLP